MEINPPPNPEKLGGKAFQLYRLREICRVPPFFVLSFDSTSEIEDADVQHSIRQLWDDSGFTVAAVRSSASVEDSASRSFAGIFESILGVSADNLIGAVEKVLKSVQSDRVQSYMEAHGISVPRIRMNVIVQELLAARTAGVSFTRLDQSKNQVVVEALGRIAGPAEGRYVDRDHPATACKRRDDPAPRVRGVAISVQQDDRRERRGALRGRVDDVRLAAGDVEQPARELHSARVEQAWMSHGPRHRHALSGCRRPTARSICGPPAQLSVFPCHV